MKRLSTCFFLFFLFSHFSFSQTYALDNTVLLTATTSSGPDAVTLQWKPYAGATQYNIYRKIPGSAAWGSAIANLTSTDSVYIDNTVVNGTTYEYRVERIAPTTGYGYVLSGVNTQMIYNHGIMLLLVDSFFIPALNTEINQLINDYTNDGWYVKMLNIGRTQAVASVKTQIIANFNVDPANTKALMLLGHIPVPYAGLINPDGHPDHLGAWPADVFYADVDGIWTDASVNDNTSASDPRNYNVPGDGKYDQSALPTNTELQIGRVDFYNLPDFPETETQLMQNYLNKLHAFKTRGFIPNDIAVVEDNFGGYAEGFSQSGYKNFSVCVGPQNTLTTDWLSNLDTLNALWSYGCGGGWYQGAGGIATTPDFATDSVLSVFNMLFGSYFGDWDVQNSFLRAPLASGTVLTNVWAGRPHWQFHQMALGYNIGYCSQKIQNNTVTYLTTNLSPGYFGRWTHIALLGDPSLRMHYIAPPNSLIAIEDANNVIHLNWTASAEVVDGYHIFRKLATDVNWTLVNTSLIIANNFDDSTLTTGGGYDYMVRAARDQQTGGGIYQNMSLGNICFVGSTATSENIEHDIFNLFPNPAVDHVFVNLNNPGEQDGSVQVFNSLGELVLTQILPAQTELISLDVQQLASGVYYVKINDHSCKFIKR
jgi:hypothetical protein